MSKTSTDGCRIGVYVCNCGTNIAKVVDADVVAERVAKLPGVVCARSYKYMCSNPGQEMITRDIYEHMLDRVLAQDTPDQLLVSEQRRPGGHPAHLLRGTAHVDVHHIETRLLNDPRRPGHLLRISAEELRAHGPVFPGNGEQFQGSAVLVQEPSGADHLGENQSGAMTLHDQSVRQVGNTRHRGRKYGVFESQCRNLHGL